MIASACTPDTAGIWAGIVTYNPELDRLEQNICAIESQVEYLVLFDNMSSNLAEIKKLIERLSALPDFKTPIMMIESDRNAGMAVALNGIAREALSSGARAVVMLDQDSVFAPRSIGRMAGLLDENVGLVTPIILDRNYEDTNKVSWGDSNVTRAITSGSLISLEAWEAVGGYDERLFVDWVDHEYCDRLRSTGYSLLRCGSATLLHEMGKQQLVWPPAFMGEFGLRHFEHRFYRQNYPAWRWQDRARSQAIVISTYRGMGIAREERILFFRGTVLRAVFFERQKVSCLKSIAKGYFEGRRCARQKV